MLFLDVDGVISLFGFAHDRPPAGRYVLVDGTMHFLSATASALIADLAHRFELVWCTGWEEKADEHLPSQLGLPRGLAHLTFAPTAATPAATPAAQRHWKLDAIDASAGTQRPLAWIDDAHDDSCRRWAADRAGPTLLVVTDPAIGITDTHVRTLDAWATSLTG
jgi:HAD domain in Swiss Army Knife RNA repair proteins